MKVHIVCSVGNPERILPRMASLLTEHLGWTYGPTEDPLADVNYYFPYLEMRKGPRAGLTAALFTHCETVQPKKVEIWDKVASQTDLRITWADQYAHQLTQTGPTAQIRPPLDREHFAPRPAAVRQPGKLRAGTSGFTYSGGRKGEAMLKELLPMAEGHELFDWSAVGRGWPVPTKGVKYSQLPDFYRSLDVYVCTSTIEGVPYGPLEALACGVPVVIPEGVGMLDSLPHMPGIIRYTAGDVLHLATALGEAKTQLELGEFDPEQLRTATEPFTGAAWIEGHARAFDEMLDTGAGDPQLAEDSDHGIYVVAYGEPSRACALDLVASIREHMPGTPVAVASDRPLPGADVFVTHPDADLGGRTVKTKMYELAPENWERVLYLDADTLLTQPINFLFDALRDGWELVCTKDIKNYDLVHSLWRRDSAEYELGWAEIGSDRALQLAGGVFGFRRCENTAAFLPQWYEEWFRLGRRDQGALLRALYRLPCRLLVLGSEWNTFDGGLSPETSEGITHRRGGPARRRYGWIKGRLDDPEMWNVKQDPAPGRKGGRVRGVAGVITNQTERRWHAQATRMVVFNGPQVNRRVNGRSGRQYRFDHGVALKVEAQDIQAHWIKEPQVWEVSEVDCPVCGAVDGICRGADIVTRETNMVKGDRVMRVPRQTGRNADRMGVVGTETGAVELVDVQAGKVSTTLAPTFEERVTALTDEELTALGLERVESGEPAEPEAKPRRRRTAAASEAG